MALVGSRLGRDSAALVLAGVATVAYAAYSLLRHAHYESKAFDMGIYDQVVWHWSHFLLPANSIQGFPRELRDHFSPVYALFAPGYWIHQGPHRRSSARPF